MQSDLFTLPQRDSKLDNCQVNDRDHIQNGAVGAHVDKIQTALIRLGGKIADNELQVVTNGKVTRPAQYLGSTSAAVVQFKTNHKPPILNFAGKIDPIVGIKTIGFLDQAMVANEKGGPPKVIPTDPPPPSTAPFTVVPFTEATPFLISQQKDNRKADDLDSAKRNDLSKLTLAARGKIAIARNVLTSVLETQMLTEQTVGGQLAKAMGTTFIQNTQVREIPFANDSALSKAVRNSKVFGVAHNKDVREQITKVFKDSIAARKVVDFHDLAASRKVIIPPVFGFKTTEDFVLKFTIGNFQGVDLFLKKFEATVTPRRWKATLVYDFFDHFGANDSDTILDSSGHGTPGQVALWVMQHERHPGHFPFIPKVTVEIDLEDTL